MNLTWEAFKQAEAKKPQSQLLDEWHDKTSFSEDESPPEELVRILESNQSTQGNILKLEQEFWNQVKESRKEELEREFFTSVKLAQAALVTKLQAGTRSSYLSCTKTRASSPRT